MIDDVFALPTKNWIVYTNALFSPISMPNLEITLLHLVVYFHTISFIFQVRLNLVCYSVNDFTQIEKYTHTLLPWIKLRFMSFVTCNCVLSEQILSAPVFVQRLLCINLCNRSIIHVSCNLDKLLAFRY